MDDEQPVEVIVNKVNRCITCGEPSVRICSHCAQEYCSQHFCPMHETNTTNEPLVDDDGTKHEGRRIRLIGEGWPNALQSLDSMSDDQLRDYIAGMRRLLEQAIQTGNYASISIAAAEYKLAYKEHSRYVAAMKRREKLEKHGQILLNAKKTKLSPDIPTDIAALMKAFGLTQAEATKMKSVLGKGQV